MPPFAPNTPEFESRRRGIIARVIEAGMPGNLRGAVHYLCALLEDGTRPDEADRVLDIILDAQGDAPDPFFRAAGNFKWNSCMFVFSARGFMDALARHAPDAAGLGGACAHQGSAGGAGRGDQRRPAI